MERDRLKGWLRTSGAAEECSGAFFLCDPNWAAAERAEVEKRKAEPGTRNENGDGWLCVRTGGTGGAVKFARHDEKTLGAAVRGFCAHLGITRVNAVSVLPMHHVSGLMAAVRCMATGGEFVAWDWKRLEAGDVPATRRGAGWVISLVPTQLQRLLTRPKTVEWLRGFEVIFVGGGPVWPELAELAVEAKLRVSLSYGMTETAAMIAALRPEEFLAGTRSSGAVMPHARVMIDPLDGVVRVAGESVFRGYWPGWRETREFVTEDFGRIDERGHLHILGRRDAVIITGGKKVQPGEVEAALRGSGEFGDVAVIGVPDREWGEIVVACYPADAARRPDIERASASLAPYQRPKRFVAVTAWPCNAQGKVNRAVLRATVEGKGVWG